MVLLGVVVGWFRFATRPAPRLHRAVATWRSRWPAHPRCCKTLSMARSIWTGAISFGLVTVPVKLYSAVSRKSVRFHQLHESTGVRIAQRRVDPSTDEEVPYDEIVKGYEIAPEKYVIVSSEELEALDPKK